MVSCQTPTPGGPADDVPGNGENPGDNGTDTKPSEFVLTADYLLVRPDEREDDEVTSIAMLGRGLKSAYKTSFQLTTDFLKKGETPNEYEILIGETNREESQAVLAELGYGDWCYKIFSNNVIVICGGSPAATLAATRAFLSDVIGYEEDEEKQVLSTGSAITLKVGTEYIYRHSYQITSFQLGQHNLKDYTIVASTKTNPGDASDAIVDHFLALTGIKLPVVSISQYTGGPAIFLGCASADDKHLDYDTYGGDRYHIAQVGDHIAIDFRNKDVAPGAVQRFLRECMPKEDQSSMTVTLDSEKPITGLYIPEGTNSLVLDSAEIKQIAQGVTYEEHLYLDANGKPVRAYIMTIEKGAATIATCLPNDEMKVGSLANIKKQVTAARNNGQNVIAGINADFFNVYPVEGLCIKDGVVLHGTGGRQWFGITKDGEAVIGEGTEYSRYEGKLITAVGGSNIVIHQDYVTNISIDHEWGYTRHPRTAVGIKHDGSVVFMVVDGRQPSISNGAALADLADILGSLGCCKAINLDGGGSSTFVLLDENENFQTMNSPSDGNLRAVADGLMVILP